MKNNIISSLIILLLLLSYCSNPSSPNDNPVWLESFLDTREAENNLPHEIWEYEYLHKTVYYVIAQCCDQFNILLDEKGNEMCLPDGGFTGKGDGKCPDFLDKRKNGKLIWEKNRSNCIQKILVDKNLFTNAPNDEFDFTNVNLVQNCLKVTIQYGGGCGDIELKLIDSGYILESYPVQRNIRLSLKDEDYCEALITKKISFDLTPIQVSDMNKVILNLTNWDKPILYSY